MKGYIKTITNLIGNISSNNRSGNSDHIMADLMSERGIMITDSQIYDFTSVEKESTDTSFTMQAENESHTEYNKEVLL